MTSSHSPIWSIPLTIFEFNHRVDTKKKKKKKTAICRAGKLKLGKFGNLMDWKSNHPTGVWLLDFQAIENLYWQLHKLISNSVTLCVVCNLSSVIRSSRLSVERCERSRNLPDFGLFWKQKKVSTWPLWRVVFITQLQNRTETMSQASSVRTVAESNGDPSRQ